MRNRLTGAILAVVAALAPSSFGLAQAAKQQGAAKAQATGSSADLTGIWRRIRRAPDNARRYTNFELALSLPTKDLAMTSWGESKFKANKPNVGPNAVPLADSNDPDIKCTPPGVPRIYVERGEPFEILQVPGRMVMVFEYDHFVRQIYADGRKHPEDAVPTWMGDSIGRWEGNTLVVDTVGFNDQTWLDYSGHPHSDALHVVERFQRVDHNTLQIDLTIEDQKAYTKPWGGRMLFELKPDWTIGEVVCEDNGNFLELQKKVEPGE